MLSEAKLKILEQLIASSSKEELLWINGYLNGFLSAGATPQVVEAKPSVGKVTIAYGTETGNAKKLAAEFASKAKKNGINAKLVNLDQYRLSDLQKEEYFLTVISTQGEGDPPAGAKKFYEHIHNNGFKVNGLKYGVLALGDTSYPLFCKAGEDVDTQLNRLGGERLFPLQKCDTDYEQEADQWFHSVLEKLGNNKGPAVAAPLIKKSTGKKTFNGTVATNINLNDRGSNKQTHHIEILAEDVDYLPGDSLGIVPENPLPLVYSILEVLKKDSKQTITYKGDNTPILELFQKKVNIYCLPQRVVARYGALVGTQITADKVSLLDLLDQYPLTDEVGTEQVIEILEPIAPRLYSIASSPEAHRGEVHLTVARDTFRVGDEVKYGWCSDYLSRFSLDSTVHFYIHKNNQFRLPAEDKDIIMIGPGTGIAPFRSFLAHRDATGATGRNWLFFGDQHFVTDFLYQTELQGWLETGVLTRLNVAFSRDQREKVYVQHKILKHGREFFAWLQSGAYIYICGAKEPMSVDVESTIIDIIVEHGQKSREEAVLYLESLSEEGRYLKDVY